MAQYYQVLSQTEKPATEELREYYPNVIDSSSQSVQYVIRPNEQAFQGSPILVSSDQLMVVDGAPQQLIVDQSQVTFQNQYILQDSNIELREGQTQQRIYYMDDASTQQVEPVQVEQVPQTIVLNHQLQGAPVLGPINSNTTPKIVMSLQRQNQINPLPQPIKQDHALIPQQRPLIHQRLSAPVVQNRTPVVAQKIGMMQNPPQRLATPIKGRRPISDVPTLHYPANRPTEIPDVEKSLARFKAIPEKKTPTTTNQVQPPNHLANAEFEPAKTSNRSPRAQPKKRANRSTTPRQNNRGPRTSKAKANKASPNNSTLVTPKAPPAPRISRPTNRMLPQPNIPVRMAQPQPQPQMNMPTPQQLQSPNPQYVIQPHNRPQPQAAVALPSYVPSHQIKKIIESTPITEEYTDSIRMLVLLSTGEQRLITFTLPKEQCTIQEILEQVGVQIEQDTKIECNETNINGINYIVNVTMAQHMSREQPIEEAMEAEDTSFQSSSSSSIVQSEPSPAPEPQPPPKIPTPEPPKELPKYVQGMLAVCSNCGYLSEDFNKCLRCRRKLPEDVKSISACDQPVVKPIENKQPIDSPEKPKPSPPAPPAQAAPPAPAPTKTNGATKPNTNASANRKKKPKPVEQETVIVSSDDEDEDANKESAVTTLKIVEPILPEIKKEPSIIEIQKCDKDAVCDKDVLKDDNSQQLSTTINCRTIRIGSYRFVPAEDIIVNSTEVVIKVPLPNDPKEVRTIVIEKGKIVKVLANFQKILPVIFYYVMPSFSNYIREQLNMVPGSEYYFDPLSLEEAFKRITILPEHFSDETKVIFKQIYGKPDSIMEELTAKEANNILLKTCPKEVTKAIGIPSCYTEIKQLLIYPPGKGGLSINTEDYLCLAQDQFLNDVIIDFYLKYLVLNLPEDKREKVHVFSTFFYKRLTTKPLKASRRVHPSEMDASLTAAQKRHARVKNWTKHVNIFEKDFIIIPINESCHWFLAIICFPGMEGCYTFDGKPVKLESKQKKKKALPLPNVTITHVKMEKPELMPCEDGEISDKDEAEGDDSEMESAEEEAEEVQPNNVPIKQPCVLIFDSLAGASRSRVVATLRDYLKCEYKIKMNTERLFNKDTIKCACPKVPQQTNFTDCGLYLLQYVESFFTDPIMNYRIPIYQLKNWFEEITVTRKREDVSKLIKHLMLKYNKDPSSLPDIIFPTLNGKLIPRLDDDDEDEDFDEEEEEEEEDDELLDEERHGTMGMMSQNVSDELCQDSETGENEMFPSEIDEDSFDGIIKPSHESISHNESFDEQTITLIKPDTSEVKKSTSRDTLSYLKAKRIVRHKNNECSDAKKFKSSESI